MNKKYYKYLLIIFLILILWFSFITYNNKNKITDNNLKSASTILDMDNKPIDTDTPLTENNNF